ncbi:hypothetical protein EW146_g2388 [Bondarzewia mesenterica]|uniref:Uncharacterized protein n=1 Tax=Bondarzewia mesenterica TaxID=1095465 RepID=A0A4S4M186_9AGAM|nr:hypothetical protein EW146_g2388 [Bondarzewia mesenterica]
MAAHYDRLSLHQCALADAVYLFRPRGPDPWSHREHPPPTHNPPSIHVYIYGDSSEGAGSAPTTPGEPADYPRPAPPGTEGEHEHEHEHEHAHNEEEVPKKEKKQGHGAHDNERKLRESAQRKAEENRPRKEGWAPGGKHTGGGGRISQPAGKAFGV